MMNKRVIGVTLLMCGLVVGVTEGQTKWAFSPKKAAERDWCWGNKRKCSKRLLLRGTPEEITDWTVRSDYQAEFEKYWEHVTAAKKALDKKLKEKKAKERVITASGKRWDEGIGIGIGYGPSKEELETRKEIRRALYGQRASHPNSHNRRSKP